MKWEEAFEQPQASPASEYRKVEVKLGSDTRNTCNPGIGDVDGDDLDELAIPVIEGDDCRITMYKGDGTELWRNTDVRLFSFFYDDMDAYKGTHWHVRSIHRHLFTRIMDIDGDGQPEVVCGDGPLWVLDGKTGALKKIIDLKAHIQTWCPAFTKGEDQSARAILAIEKRDGSGSGIACIGPDLEPEWIASVEGRSFEDAIWAGDVDCDGRDEIVYATDSTASMFLMDADGEVRWKQRVEGVLGDDTHVDDLVIDTVKPGNDRQLLMATGPALIDAKGKILWSKGEDYHHAQRVLSIPMSDDPTEPRRVYFCESYRRAAYGLDHEGKELWSFKGFQKARPEYEKQFTPRLTTAGGLADWNGDGKPVIVQAELIGMKREMAEQIEGECRGHAHILNPDGEELGCLPFEDKPGWPTGAMCALSGRFLSADRESIAVIMHCGSRMFFFGKAV